MRKITLENIINPSDYERRRNDLRSHLIEIKKNRRVQLGEALSFLFENKETILFQIQEMIRIERMTKKEEFQELIDTYSSLIPQLGELSCTMFIELLSQERLREELKKLKGIDQAVFLKIGETSLVPARFEAGGSRGELPDTVQYLKFSLEPAQVAAFQQEEVSLVVDHPNYKASAKINVEIKRALLPELLEQEG